MYEPPLSHHTAVTLTTPSCDRTRDGHVRFWRAPWTVPSLCHLCRSILRHSVSTHQMEPLPLPKRILQYLTYRNIPDRLKTCCSSDEEEWEGWNGTLTQCNHWHLQRVIVTHPHKKEKCFCLPTEMLSKPDPAQEASLTVIYFRCNIPTLKNSFIALLL